MSVATRIRDHVLYTAVGTGLGALASAIALLVGLVRFILAVPILMALAFFGIGAKPHFTTQDSAATIVRDLLFYVDGFIVGGALGGFIWPLLPWKWGKLVSFAVAGIAVTFSISIGMSGSLAALDREDRISMTLLGALFGMAFGYGLLKGDWGEGTGES